MRSIQYLNLDINKKTQQTITANVGEVGSRYIKIKMIDNDRPLDLTGVGVFLYALKSDDTKVFSEVEIEDAKNGILMANLTSQLMTKSGSVKLTLVLLEQDKKLGSKEFVLNVDESILDDEVVESTNEFSALTTALGKVQGIDNKFANIDEQFNTIKSDKADKNEVYLKQKGININDFDEQTRRTFLESQGIDVNYVLGEGNVKEENTTFINCPVNLAKLSQDYLEITKDDRVDNVNISFNNNIFTASITEYYAFIYLKIANLERGKKYKLNVLYEVGNNQCRLYNEAKNDLVYNANINNNNAIEFTAIENVVYLRYYITTENPKVTVSELKVFESDNIEYSLQNNVKIKNENLSLKDNLLNGTYITNKTIEIEKFKNYIPSINLFNNHNVVKGKLFQDGNFVDNEEYYYTIIKVDKNTEYVVRTARVLQSINGEGIKTPVAFKTNNIFETLSDTEYILFCGKISTELDKNILVKGTDLSVLNEKQYTEYKFELEGLDIKSGWSGKTITTFGDSITEMGKWQPYVVNKLGCVIDNQGQGGTKIAIRTDIATDATSSMCTDTRINKISANTDCILIMGGANDSGQSIPLGNDDDNTPYTFNGALNILIEKIHSKFPKTRIIFMTSPYRVFGIDKSSKNEIGLTIQDYNDVIRKKAKQNHIKVIDVSNECGFNKYNYTSFLLDEVHPNSDFGCYNIALSIINGLKSVNPIQYRLNF